MNEQQRHEMVLEMTHASGSEEWYCPVCGRRMLVDWEPKFKRTVLEIGDPYASHGGFKGGSEMEAKALPLNEVPAEEDVTLDVDEARLIPWQQWLEQSRFDDLWSRDLQ